MPDKNALRSVVRDRLRKGEPQNHAALRENLAALLRRLESECWVAYLAFQQEPNLDELLDDLLANSKSLVIPRFNHETLSYDLVPVTDLHSQVAVGHHGIREPLPELPAIDRLPESTGWLTPGLAFTVRGARLGRGAGHYDRLFLRFPQGKRIGIAWECQMLDEIPGDPWDIPMDFITTEARTVDCRAPFT
ncbi:MAG: 5-formyltetrahydrofolate cyclo-ligase [Victivallales bacterium]|nr:5-formyltetrahydrofolate cyclo-ligase [Victivallales bacterium]